MSNTFIKFIIIPCLFLYSCSSPTNTPNVNTSTQSNNNSSKEDKQNNTNNSSSINTNNQNNDGILGNKSADSNPISVVNNNSSQNNTQNQQNQQQVNVNNTAPLNSNAGRVGIIINFNPPCKKNVDPNCN